MSGPLDAHGEELYVDDMVEPVRHSRGPRRVVGIHGDRVLLADGLLIRASDVVYRR